MLEKLHNLIKKGFCVVCIFQFIDKYFFANGLVTSSVFAIGAVDVISLCILCVNKDLCAVNSGAVSLSAMNVSDLSLW